MSEGGGPTLKSLLGLFAIAVPLLVPANLNGGVRLEDNKTPSITKHKPTSEEQVLDLSNPPALIKDKLKGHQGFTWCVFSLNWSAEHQLQSKRPVADGIEASVMISKLDATLDLKMTVYLPTAPSTTLKDHEAGHKKIAERMYEGADAAAHRLAQAKLGKTYTGKGANEDAACAAATKKAGDELLAEYLEAIEAEGQRVHDIYDRITDHGSRATPSSNEGVRQAFEERKKQKTSSGR